MIGRITVKKRMIRGAIASSIVIAGLIVRIGFIQFVQGKELSDYAYEQQTADRKVNPKRGTIYDSTKKQILAESSTVETITVNPVNIQEKEKVAKELSNLFELNYEEVLKKISKRTSIVSIAKKVEKEKSNELRKWMQESNIKEGINIDEDTKRYYPLNNFASQVIGFCGGDNQGLNGIEAIYEENLKGQQGSISKMTDASGKRIKNTYEEYNNPTEGDDLVLTIDYNIQSIAEKYLKEACIDNKCEDGGNVIIMNPQNGDILALAGYPNYNLNDPFAVDESLSKEEQTNQMQLLWRNKAISDTYEPGSTFKIVTASASLEEGITTPDKPGEFCCTGHIEVAGVKMKCWRYYKPHGSESLREALMNSCNPVFIGLGQKIGVQKYYKYIRKFGFFNRTGIDLPGEANSIFLDEGKVGPVELATISFGQRFEVTPIQMATMLSSIGNKGVYVKPHLIKEIISNTEKDENGERKTTVIEKEEGDRVISEETAKNILSMMQSVVDEGTGKKAKVEGIGIGGKTGTSEDGVNTNKYIASFIGIGPTENPQIVILVTLYNPKGEGGHTGGGVAAPLAGNILNEIFQYLN
ncbi:MAG: peptidoglycan glycosyltransferase [Clostridia bacterium]|nr:peptidoglycan glycosyltransferase [Clostridia bacterium]